MSKQKYKIYISGGISGGFTILNKLSSYSEDYKKGMFNTHFVYYSTKKEAINALSKVYQKLRAELRDENSETRLTYFRGYSLSYDDSRAEIFEN